MPYTTVSCFIVGGFKEIGDNFVAQDTILEFLEDKWTEAGTQLQARGTPGVSTVPINSDMIDSCE